MQRALKRHWLPELQKFGFSGSWPDFRRLGPENLDVVCVAFWKYGGQFVLDFARTNRGQRNWGGELIPDESIHIGYVDTPDRARLGRAQPVRPPDYFHGFDFSSFADVDEPYDQLARDVAALLPAIDQWLCEKKVHPQIRSSA